MGLKIKQMIFKGLNANDVYVKINEFYGTKESIEFYVNFYANKEIADNAPGEYLLRQNYSFHPSVLESAPNFLKQMYEYLKTLDEYKDAIDVLEDGNSE